MNPGKKHYGGLNLSANVGAEEKQADLETILKAMPVAYEYGYDSKGKGGIKDDSQGARLNNG